MSSKYTKSARGQDCTIRLIGICNRNPETVVLAHLNGAGMGLKHADIHAAYCCSSCHDVIDGRQKTAIDDRDIMLDFYAGMVRTQQIMIKNGVLKL